MTVKVNIISVNPGDKTITLTDFLKVLHPEGKRVWRKIQVLREKKNMEKTVVRKIQSGSPADENVGWNR